jgi:hypothetical protein
LPGVGTTVRGGAEATRRATGSTTPTRLLELPVGTDPLLVEAVCLRAAARATRDAIVADTEPIPGVV